MTYRSLTWEQKQRRIPKLPNHPVKHPGGPDKGAPLPAPQPGFEYRNLASLPYEAPVIVAVAKPPYAQRSGKWQR